MPTLAQRCAFTHPLLGIPGIKTESLHASHWVTYSDKSAERQALEPIHSRNIIKLQITDNHTQFGIHSKSKSF
jgi:hypothetical protein